MPFFSGTLYQDGIFQLCCEFDALFEQHGFPKGLGNRSRKDYPTRFCLHLYAGNVSALVYFSTFLPFSFYYLVLLRFVHLSSFGVIVFFAFKQGNPEKVCCVLCLFLFFCPSETLLFSCFFLALHSTSVCWLRYFIQMALFPAFYRFRSWKWLILW